MAGRRRGGHAIAGSLLGAGTAVVVALLLVPTGGAAGPATVPATSATAHGTAPAVLRATATSSGGATGGPPPLHALSATVAVGFEPANLTWVPGTGLVYVLNSLSNNVSILRGHRVAATVGVGKGPTGSAYDALSGYVYVADSRGAALTVLRGEARVGSIPLAAAPGAIVDDPVDHVLFVTEPSAGRVVVVRNLSVAGTIAVGTSPTAAVFDPADGETYVSNQGSATVSVLTPGGVLANVPVGSGPTALAYQAAEQEVYVANTGSASVTLLANTSVVATVPVGSEPSAFAQDPRRGWVEVVNSGSNNVSLLNGTANLGSVPVGVDPTTATYDPANGYVYVANSGSSNVSVLSGPLPLGPVTVGSRPSALVANSSSGLLYVANELSVNVSVLNGLGALDPVTLPASASALLTAATGGATFAAFPSLDRVGVLDGPHLLRTIPVGTAPSALVAVGTSGRVAVLNTGSANVSFVNLTEVLGTTAVGGTPVGAAYDPGNGELYVACASGNVTILNGTAVAANLSVGASARAPIYDPHTGNVYVADPTDQDVSVLHGNAIVGSIALGAAPGLLVLDSSTGAVLALSIDSAAAWLLSGTTTSTPTALAGIATAATYWAGADRFAVATSGSENLTWLSDAAQILGGVPLGALSPDGLVVDSASGLLLAAGPGGVGVLIGAGGGVATVNTTATAGAPAYDAADGMVLVPDTASASLAVLGPSAYTVSFTETGLPPGTNWSVTLAGQNVTTSSTLLVRHEGIGSYPYSVGVVPSYGVVATPRSPLTVNDHDLSVSLSFAPETPRSVTFHERGLPAAQLWCVTLGRTNCTNASSLVFPTVYPGRHPFVVGPVPGYSTKPRGNVTVVGSDVNRQIRFSQVTYAVSVAESGLPVGHRWKATLGTESRSGRHAELAFHAPNGTFSYAVRPIAGWTITNRSGSVLVNGSAVVVQVAFVRVTYLVQFEEDGLPNGTNWSVTLRTTTHWSNGTPNVTFTVPNGTYRFRVGPVVGYQVSGAAHRVRVHGAPTNITAGYRPGASRPQLAPAVLVPPLLGLAIGPAMLLRRRPEAKL